MVTQHPTLNPKKLGSEALSKSNPPSWTLLMTWDTLNCKSSKLVIASVVISLDLIRVWGISPRSKSDKTWITPPQADGVSNSFLLEYTHTALRWGIYPLSWMNFVTILKAIARFRASFSEMKRTTYPVSTPIRDWSLSADRVLAFLVRLAS